MKRIVLAQVLTSGGKTEFSGLYDENGNAVTVEMEKDGSGACLTISRIEPVKEHRDCGISEEEISNCCMSHDDCTECPLNDYCKEEFGND